MQAPSLTYCTKCKTKTPVGETLGHKQVGHRHFWFHKCPVCGIKKSTVVPASAVKEGGFIFDLLGKILSPITSIFK